MKDLPNTVIETFLLHFCQSDIYKDKVSSLLTLQMKITDCPFKKLIIVFSLPVGVRGQHYICNTTQTVLHSFKKPESNNMVLFCSCLQHNVTNIGSLKWENRIECNLSYTKS
ncbi:hypothetical protein AMECASPLE_037785 [Ameca splendens]|uniref:Uncharacterized protein n=1 Tax=Ameca splendens TaxID=208324 RepID=A0ABV0YJ56_9TELE